MITRAAAAVPRLRDGRVLAGVRTHEARSFPGYFAFPGGVTDDGDEDLPRATDVTVEARERGAALRELGEETGRWLLCTAAHESPRAADLERFARGVTEGALLAEVLRDTGLLLDDRALVPLGRWVTPDFLPRRFDVRQFLLQLEDEPAPLHTPTPELTDLAWRTPQELFAAWRAGDALLLPPIRFVVERLHMHTNRRRADAGVERLVADLRDLPGDDVPELRDIVVGIAVQPYGSLTLPPAQHTNTVLLGAGDFLIVDPATPYPEEQRRFDALLDRLAQAGRSPRAIVLTHHHADHIADVERLVQERALPVWAHEQTAGLVDFAVDRLLRDGEVIVCPGDPERRFVALHTPGHAAGHLCFLEEETGVLVAGDMVASVGSILIDPDEGHMGTYFASLKRLLAGATRRVIPAHGPMLADGNLRLAQQLEHRERRQDAVLAALPTESPGATALELVPGIYGGDTPESMFPLAARSVTAALQLLGERGLADQVDGRWFARALG